MADSMMIVPGKSRTAVPDHLGSMSAVSNGLRIKWRLFDLFLYTVLTVLALVLVPLLLRWDHATIALAVGSVAYLVMFVWSLIEFVFLLKDGATPMMKVTGIRWIGFDSGRPDAWATLKKLLLEGVLASVSLGIAPFIICLASQDGLNRTWFDRVSGVIDIDTKQGRDPVKEPYQPAVAPAQEAPKPWSATGSSASMLPPAPLIEQVDVPSMATLPAGPADAYAPTGSYIDSVPWGAPSDVQTATSPVPPSPVPAAPVPPAPSPAGQVPAAPVPEAPVPPASAASDPGPGAPATSTFTASTPASFPQPHGGTPYPAPPAMPSRPVAPPSPHSFAPAASADDELDQTQLGPHPTAVSLIVDDGTVLHLTGTVVLGRNPIVPDSNSGAAPVAIVDPDRTISKTHMALTPTGASVLVEDLHSTGGTVIITPAGEETALQPGAPALAHQGDIIRFGQRRLKVGE